MEPRLKWNKIVLEAERILFHFRRGSMLKYSILTWNHGFKYVTRLAVH